MLYILKIVYNAIKNTFRCVQKLCLQFCIARLVLAFTVNVKQLSFTNTLFNDIQLCGAWYISALC